MNIKIATLQKEMCKAAKEHAEVVEVTLSEWVSLVLHTGADVAGESPDRDDDDDDDFLVHTRKLIEGVCLMVHGDWRKKEEEREVKVNPPKPDPKLYAICRELQRLIQDDVAIAPNKQDDWKPMLDDDPRLD